MLFLFNHHEILGLLPWLLKVFNARTRHTHDNRFFYLKNTPSCVHAKLFFHICVGSLNKNNQAQRRPPRRRRACLCLCANIPRSSGLSMHSTNQTRLTHLHILSNHRESGSQLAHPTLTPFLDQTCNLNCDKKIQKHIYIMCSGGLSTCLRSKISIHRKKTACTPRTPRPNETSVKRPSSPR